MARTTVLVTLILCFTALAIAKKTTVEKAGTNTHAKEWTRTSFKPVHDEQITLGFALKQKNLDQLSDVFWRVSDPKSEDFGKHLTNQELASLIGSGDDTIHDVKRWLQSHDAKSIKVSDTRDYIWATLNARDVEELLSVELSLFTHESPLAEKRAVITLTTDKPKVPKALASEIDFVSGVWNFPSTKALYKKGNDVSRMLSELKTKVAPVIDDDASVPVVPYILQAIGAPQAVEIYFIPICSTGNETESLRPCSDFANPIVSYNATTVQYDYTTNKVVTKSQIFSADAVNCTIESSLFGDLLYCIVNVTGLLNDAYVNASLSYCFQDKTCSTTVYVSREPVVPSAYHTPTDVRAHYGVPSDLKGSSPKNAQAVAAFIYQFFSPADLALFFKEMGLPAYTVQKIIGPNNPPFPGTEASLDIQYIMGIAQGVNTWFWSMGGSSWIAEWGQAVLNTPNAPWVHSISYGEEETDVAPAYIARSEVELQKLGAAGHSIMISSGDDGSGDDCDTYSPDWPTSSPHVTSVGATRISRGATVACQTNPVGQGCEVIGEVGVSGDLGLFWSSGGGFSNLYSRPDYQTIAVANYLSNAPLPPAKAFNKSGRAYPDVSAVGHNLLVVDAGVTQPVDGTSASSPIFAGIVSLLNEERILAGKSPLGFLNPWIYSIGLSSGAFYDVTVGDTTSCSAGVCCPTSSYQAFKGWDVASGWGTPVFPVLVKEALKLQ